MPELRPAVGTRLTGDGVVVHRSVSRYGLHRMAVEITDKYPDIARWLEMLDGGAQLKTWYYAERISSGVFVGTLWMFWKEG